MDLINMNWYYSILREILKLGNNIFLIDSHQLLKDLNFYNDLSKSFQLHEYKTDGDLYQFYYKNNIDKILVHSTKPVQLGFLRKNFTMKEISISDVFQELDEKLLKEIDISYYQTIYNYYSELRSQGRRIDTEDILYRSIWNIDLGELFSKTANLKIALSYIIDEKDLPDKIIQSASEKLSVNIKELKEQNEKFISFLKQINKEYISNIKTGKLQPYDLKDDVIQIQLIKAILKYNIDTELIFQKYPFTIKESTKEIDKQKIEQLVKLLNTELTELQQKIFDFNDIPNLFKLSKHFSEILFLIHSNKLKTQDFLNLDQTYNDFDELLRKHLINNIENNYESLFHLPDKKTPITIDKILNHIQKNYQHQNIALIIMDGMSYDEWFILKKQLTDFTITEKASFAILPTITSFSRTAILTGKTPNQFLDNNLKRNEKNEFYQALTERGYNKDNILYGHINLKNNTVTNGTEPIPFNQLQNYDFLGLICNLIDNLSHEDILTKNQKSSLYNKIDYEIKNSKLINLFKQLKSFNYTIVLISDHGNIFCKGNNIRPNKNLEISSRSKRCILYDNSLFAENILNKNPENTFTYRYRFIPDNLTIVFPTKNQCFIKEQDYKITHGGISPEELIVPVVILT